MELDSLKFIWKKMEERPLPVQRSDYYQQLFGQKFQDRVSMMRRNLFRELVLAIVLYVPAITWFLFGFNGRLPEPALFLLLMGLLFAFYYVNKRKLLNKMLCPDCAVKDQLEQQLVNLQKYIRLYLYASVGAVPAFLGLSLVLLYAKLPAAHSFLYPSRNQSAAPVILFWLAVFIFLTAASYFANRWWVRKMYGEHIRKLRSVLDEMRDA